LGFVLARVGRRLHEIGTKTPGLTRRTLPIGIGLAGFGALLTLLAAWRYDTVNRDIETGLVKTDRGLVWFVAIAIALLSGLLIVYMLVG
ncbi:MAG: hypothetical protein ABR514_06290, partial [Chthoniobacterales bacterium]